MNKSLLAIAVASALAIGSPPVSAGIALANSGFTSADSTIDFDDPNGDLLLTDVVLGSFGGVTFNRVVLRPSGYQCDLFGPGISGNGCIGNFPEQVGDPAQDAGTNPWSMAFASGIGSLAFGFYSNGDLKIELFDGDTSITSQTLDVSSPGRGFVQITGYIFDKVSVEVSDAPFGAANVMLADNLQFSRPDDVVVPEPGSLALALLALGTLGGAIHRRRRSTPR